MAMNLSFPKAGLLSKGLLFLFTLLLCFAEWFVSYFRFFPHSQSILGPLLILPLLIIFLTGFILLIAAPFRYLSGKKPGVLTWNLSLGALWTVLHFLVMTPLLPQILPEGSDRLPFDAASWQAEDAAAFRRDDITPRQMMLRDLIKHVLPGKNRKEIVTLLGPQTKTDKWKNRRHDLIYVLGPERGIFPIDDEWLFITLENDRFKEASLSID